MRRERSPLRAAKETVIGLLLLLAAVIVCGRKRRAV